VLRLSHPSRSSNAAEFPNSPDALLDALRNGDPQFLGESQDLRIPLDRVGLDASTSKNPAACAEVFGLLMNVVYEVLLGIEQDTTGSGSHRQAKASRPFCERPNGLFGQTKAVFSVVEVQGRLTLHRYAHGRWDF